MEMKLRLHDYVYDLIRNKTKDVEVRVNDEKRRQLHIGDTLIFINRGNEEEQTKVTVTNLVYFKNFKEVAENYSMERLYLKDTSKEEYVKLFDEFYSQEDVEKYGVVAIEFKYNYSKKM